jgi:hypothetical protein
MKKYVVGLGCSWTQGQGGYPKEIWDRYNGRIDISGDEDQHLREYEHSNSWVNVLCRDYLNDHTPINLGVRGCGNRGAVKQLYFSNIDWSQGSGYIILTLTGLDRFDFLREDLLKPDNTYHHYKYNTIWPDNSSDSELWRGYANSWSEQIVAHETMLAMLELQNFCKLYNYKLIIANGFNTVDLKDHMHEYATPLSKKFNWQSYLHGSTDYVALVEKLIQLDGAISSKDWKDFYTKYEKFNYPKQYLTNCSHPTIQGYKIIASELYNFISLST